MDKVNNLDKLNEAVSQSNAEFIAEVVSCHPDNVRKVLRGRHFNKRIIEVAKRFNDLKNSLRNQYSEQL